MNIEYRKASFNAAGTIDCEINHPGLGWIPFTASSDDVEEFGRELYEQLRAVAAPHSGGVE